MNEIIRLVECANRDCKLKPRKIQNKVEGGLLSLAKTEPTFFLTALYKIKLEQKYWSRCESTGALEVLVPGLNRSRNADKLGQSSAKLRLSYTC